MIGQLSKSGRWLARVALVPTNPDAGRSPRSTTSRRDAPTQRASEALTTRRLGDDRTERDSVPAMTDVDRIYLGETDRRYVCDGCDGWCRWSGWATLAGGSASRPTAAWAGPDTGPLDRPAPGTPYRCTRCGREHVGAPGAQRTNVTIAPKGARVSEMRIRRSIERRQALLLDGIRMSIEMAQIGYRRLQSAARRRQAVERVGEPSLDAWALVDTLNRLRSLISHMISALAVFIRPATAIASSTWTWPTGGR